jgi:hypothetical protein
MSTPPQGFFAQSAVPSTLTGETIDASQNTLSSLQTYPDYTIYISGGNYKARNWSTGVTTSNSDASTLINSVITALSNGGNIAFMSGTFTIQSPLVGWANFRTYEMNGTWDNARARGTQFAIGTSFPNNGYIFDTSANTVASGTRNILYLDGFEFYNINTGTVPNAGAILYETDVADLSSNFVFRNLFMQYMWRGIHLKGPAWYGIIDNIMFSSASSTSVGNAALIIEIAGHADTPKSNLISHFRGSGPIGAQLDQFIIMKDGGYNTFIDTYCDGFKFTEAVVVLQGNAIDNVFYRMYFLDQNTSTGTNEACLKLDGVNGTTQPCVNNRFYDCSLTNYPNAVKFVNNPERNHIELAAYHGTAAVINDAGAGYGNKIIALEGQIAAATADAKLTTSNNIVEITDSRPSASTRIKTGEYLGKQTAAVSGLFTAFSITGVPVVNYDSTNGSSTKCPTTASTGNACGIRYVGATTLMTKFNPRFYVKFNVDTNTNNRFYIGMNQSGADWTVGDEPGANAWYILVGARSTDTVFVIGSNAQSGTGTFVNYNKDGVGGTLALDTAIHEVRINCYATGFNVQIDNNSIHTITSPIPSSTVALWCPVIDIQTNENVIHNMFVYYARLDVQS